MEYALYVANVPITGMLYSAYIVEMAVDNAADHADYEEPPEAPTTAETRNLLHLLRNKLECSGGGQLLMRCLEQFKIAFLGPEVNTKQANITQFFLPQ